MKNELIAALKKRGFKRWTKDDIDRLYIDSTRIGLELECYKTGNICRAYLNGERISNGRAADLKVAKNYIDIATGECISKYEEFTEAMLKILKEETDRIEHN